MADPKNKKLQLDYPCAWIYKIIGTDQNDMQAAVAEIISDRACKISVSRLSENAKYISLDVEITVESEPHRLNLYEALQAHRAITLVL
jgi:hypothetical protein